jgi:anti-sigma factor RsiW
MTNAHLTEEERQSLADGTLAAERVAGAEAHVQVCDACAADVLRLSRIVTRAREARVASEPGEADLWPSIRERIEQKKVVPLPESRSPESRSLAPLVMTGRGRIGWIIGAAGLIAASAMIVVLNRPAPGPDDAAVILRGGSDEEISLVAATDSARVYQEEAQELLDNLELAKARLRPEAAAAFDKDMKTVDSAIVEIKGAITKDPANRALRHLLAASYRQKVDLLKRLSNAG